MAAAGFQYTSIAGPRPGKPEAGTENCHDRGQNVRPTILREYDIRGIVRKTLTADDVRTDGRAFGSIVAGRAATGWWSATTGG
jgi:hypothetical protein